jgi:hypothetical protein
VPDKKLEAVSLDVAGYLLPELLALSKQGKRRWHADELRLLVSKYALKRQKRAIRAK